MAIEVTPLHPTLGAEVRGVDLTRPVMPEVSCNGPRKGSVARSPTNGDRVMYRRIGLTTCW
jgi:hypothetical protein